MGKVVQLGSYLEKRKKAKPVVWECPDWLADGTNELALAEIHTAPPGQFRVVGKGGRNAYTSWVHDDYGTDIKALSVARELTEKYQWLGSNYCVYNDKGKLLEPRITTS